MYIFNFRHFVIVFCRDYLFLEIIKQLFVTTVKTFISCQINIQTWIAIVRVWLCVRCARTYVVVPENDCLYQGEMYCKPDRPLMQWILEHLRRLSPSTSHPVGSPVTASRGAASSVAPPSTSVQIDDDKSQVYTWLE